MRFKYFLLIQFDLGGMIICGENSGCYEGVYQQFFNGFCGNCLPMAKGLRKRHLEIVVHV